MEKLQHKIKDGVKCGFLIRSEKANENYSTDFILRLLTEEGKNVFTARESHLGHMQQVFFFSLICRTFNLILQFIFIREVHHHHSIAV